MIDQKMAPRSRLLRMWFAVLSAAALVSACGGATVPATNPPTDTVAPSTVVPTSATTAGATTTLPSTVPTTTELPAAPMTHLAELFEPLPEEAIVPLGAKGEWDSVRSGPGAVVFHDGSLHMFRNASDDNLDRKNAVDYWRSDDGGGTWVNVSEGPVFDGSDIDYVSKSVLYVTSALVEDDGTWVLYFHTWDGSSWQAAAGRIGRATAPSPFGPWAADDKLVLTDDDESWDSYAVRSPSVLKVDGEYVMYYEGASKVDKIGSVSIGRATSPDGITWVKDPNPLRLDKEDGWSSVDVFQPNVVKVEGGWIMFFSSSNNVTTGLTRWHHGFAVSENGIDWVQDETPLAKVRSETTRINQAIEFAWAEGRFFVFTEDAPSEQSPTFGWTYEGTLIDK